jgi:hypothetical protein
MGGFFGVIIQKSGSSGGGVGILGPSVNYASPAGGAVAAAPAGFTTSTGRIVVTLPSGSATWISLTHGTDGQLCDIQNADVANTLTLPAANFPGLGVFLPPGAHILLYYDAAAALWETTSP